MKIKQSLLDDGIISGCKEVRTKNLDGNEYVIAQAFYNKTPFLNKTFMKTHKARVLTPEQVMQQRSNAYKFLNL